MYTPLIPQQEDFYISKVVNEFQPLREKHAHKVVRKVPEYIPIERKSAASAKALSVNNVCSISYIF